MDKEKLIKIGDYLLKGMTEKESCILSDVSYSTFLKSKETNESTRKYLEKKLVEFKLAHVETIQRNKSEKNSMYLLEKLRPEEFGSKVKPDGGNTINIISAIMKDIQNDNTNAIVSFSRGGREESIKDAEQSKKEGPGLLN